MAALGEVSDSINSMLDKHEQHDDDDTPDSTVVMRPSSRKYMLEIGKRFCLIKEQETEGKNKKYNSTHHLDGDGAIA